jgi:hypothetical protein
MLKDLLRQKVKILTPLKISKAKANEVFLCLSRQAGPFF